MAKLRDPDGGCPWDLEQTFATIAPYTVEEAYEVADAIERGDLGDLKEELGDLLLQVVFHSRMAQEQGAFDFAGVAAAINDKMIRRHPHVFGDHAYDDQAAQVAGWEALKAQERKAKAKTGVLDDVPAGPPGPDPRREADQARRPRRLRLALDRRCWTSCARRSPSSRSRSRPATRPRPAKSWATCCSSAPTWPASWTSSPRTPCAPPTPSSAAASPSSRPLWPRTADARPVGPGRDGRAVGRGQGGREEEALGHDHHEGVGEHPLEPTQRLASRRATRVSPPSASSSRLITRPLR
jgi:NTP pyrophosphatase (non-canonical NTP hydrolase)